MSRPRANSTGPWVSRRTQWIVVAVVLAFTLPLTIFLFVFANTHSVPDPRLKDANSLDKLEAIDACKEAILARANHPSTVQFPMLDYDLRDDGDGNAILLTTFTGRNGFNLELKFDATCMFDGKSVSDVQIDERKAS